MKDPFKLPPKHVHHRNNKPRQKLNPSKRAITSPFRTPSSETNRKSCTAALNRIDRRYASRNIMARELGVSRNTVTYWFTKGFIGHAAAVRMHQAGILPLEESRPDLLKAYAKHLDLKGPREKVEMERARNRAIRENRKPAATIEG